MKRGKVVWKLFFVGLKLMFLDCLYTHSLGECWGFAVSPPSTFSYSKQLNCERQTGKVFLSSK